MTALKGRSIALSVSDAPDRARLGLPAREVDRALFSICTVLVRAGAKIVYAGNLDPNGLTFSMFRHLTGAYASAQQVPFIHIVPEAILRGASFAGLVSALREGAAVVETRIHIEDNLLSIRAVEDGLRVGEGGQRIRLRNDEEFNGWLDARQALDSVSALVPLFSRVPFAELLLHRRRNFRWTGLGTDALECPLRTLPIGTQSNDATARRHRVRRRPP